MSEEPTSSIVENKLSGAATEEDKQSEAPKDVVPIIPPGFKGIFSLKSKNQSAKERFNQKAQDYLESHKMSIYL